MKPQQAFKFCPKCGNSLVRENWRTLICQKCRFHFYVSPWPAASAIIISEKNEILLARRARDPKKGMWEIVGGFIEPGESLENAVKREVKEELGVEIELLDFIGGFPHEKYELEEINFPAIGFFYTAKITRGSPKPNDDIDAFKFVSASKVLSYPLAFDDGRLALEEYLKRDS